MSKAAFTTVRDALDGAGAMRLNECTLNQDLSLALWSNQNVRVGYQQVAHHTLSLYLSGGYRTRRLDRRDQGFGGPDKLCLMPAARDSQWEVGQYQEFVHLYISDAGLKHFALESFDCDPRRVELPDLTFFENPEITATCRQLLQVPWTGGAERLLLQQSALELMGQLIRCYVRPTPAGASRTGYVKGGLSRRQLNRARDYIDTHYGDELCLEMLAGAAGLSRYHFARMFKLSTGLSPHQYVTRVRVQRGREMLEAGLPQAQVAARCGFAHQSHFAAHFKRHLGVTPGQYLRSR